MVIKYKNSLVRSGVKDKEKVYYDAEGKETTDPIEIKRIEENVKRGGKEAPTYTQQATGEKKTGVWNPDKNRWESPFTAEDRDPVNILKKNTDSINLDYLYNLLFSTKYEFENPDAYEYYTGKNNFSKDIKNQKVMLNEVYGQTSVVWNNYLHKYILAASSNFWESRIIKFYVSDTPIGPWYNTKAKIKIPQNRQNKKVELVYCAFFHPSLFEENGKIMYLTYSLMLKNSGFDANCEMVKVEIEEI